jgi:RNA polymerase sigma factor (sigma-70 family)
MPAGNDNFAGERMGDRSAGGDMEWIPAAVRDYERRLIAYATHLIGNAERGRDLAQDTFVRLCGQDRQQIEPRLVEWLFTVCRNLCIDARRKERRMKALTDEQAELRISRRPDPSEHLEQEEAVAGALAALQTLTPNQQEVIRLKFQHGLSYKQIAQVTTLSVSNVGFLIHTALKILRARLIESGDDIGAELPRHVNRIRD